MDPENYRSDENLDDVLQRELDEALSDISMGSFIEADLPPTSDLPAGVRRGRVIGIHRDDIFVDMGGKSQGVIAAGQFEGQALPTVGSVIEVTIEGYDKAEGLLLLSRKGAVQAATWQRLDEGQLVEGRVTAHNKGGLELDINGIKAFMPISQVELFHVEDLAPYVNQRFKAQVIEVRRDERTVVVSRREILLREEAAARAQAFETLVEGNTVSGIVRSIMPYGAFVDLGGVDGLLHISDMAHSRVGKAEDVVQVGQRIEVKILKVDRETRKIGLGLKQILPDPWTGADQKWPADSLATGRVTRLADFGAFVELESGVEGLVPISEMTFTRRIGHPSELLKVGDVTQVRVMKVDVPAKRISLSIKRVGDDPWTGSSFRWPINSMVTGLVKRTTEFGAFIELTPGVEGLVHISELSDNRVRAVTDVVKEGQTVQAKVLSVDEEQHRISLSIKQLASMPEYTGADATAEPEPEPGKPKKRKKPLKGGLDW